MAGFFAMLGLSIVIAFMITAAMRIHHLATLRERGRREVLECLAWCVGAFGVLAALALLFPAQASAPEAARRSQCVNNLKQIVLAMENYHRKYRCFPPAYTVDSTGQHLHSWRVLLLPFLEQKDVYDRLRLDEPYDSPHNRAVFESAEFEGHGRSLNMPGVFRCPSDRKNRTDTNYVLIVGPRTLSNGPKSVRLKDITDGASNTIAVVEIYDSGIRWYEPRDLSAEQMSFRINDLEYVGIASRHPGGAQVGLADGSVRFLSEDTDPRVVEALTTVNGKEKEKLPPDW